MAGNMMRHGVLIGVLSIMNVCIAMDSKTGATAETKKTELNVTAAAASPAIANTVMPVAESAEKPSLKSAAADLKYLAGEFDVFDSHLIEYFARLRDQQHDGQGL